MPAEEAQPNPQTGSIRKRNPHARDVESTNGSSRKHRKGKARTLKRLVRFAVIGVSGWRRLFYLHPELRVKGPFDVLPVRNADVRSGVEGIIEQIVVDEGQTVQKDDLIAQLMDRDVRAELQKTKAAIQEAQAKLKLLVAGPRQEEIQQAGGGQRPRRLS